MVKLPTSHLIPSVNIKNDGNIYRAIDRIAIAPEHTIRINTEASNMSPAAMVRNAVTLVNPATVERSEVIKKSLFLDALGVIAARKGINILPELLMNQTAGKQSLRISFTGSQNIILRADFKNVVDKLGSREYLALAGNHALGKYKFAAGFLGDNPEIHPLSEETNVTQPFFMVDNSALQAMEMAGVPQEKIQQYFESFMKIAEIAEHDYLHGTIIPYFRNGQEFRCFAHYQKSEISELTPLETHALALHADIIKELFFQNPKRKDTVLKWAAQNFKLITEIQQIMLDTAETKEQKNEAYELGTYLSSIYMDRFLRVIATNDPDLNRPVYGNCSVFSELDKIQVLLNKRRPSQGNVTEHQTKREIMTAVSLLDAEYNQAANRSNIIHNNTSNSLVKVMVTDEQKAIEYQKRSDIPSHLSRDSFSLDNIETYSFITEHATADQRHKDAGEAYKKIAHAIDKKIAASPKSEPWVKANRDLVHGKETLRIIKQRCGATSSKHTRT